MLDRGLASLSLIYTVSLCRPARRGRYGACPRSHSPYGSGIRYKFRCTLVRVKASAPKPSPGTADA